MSKFSRDKGIRAEREIVNILKAELGDDLEIGRNLEQTRDGGHDISGNLPFSIEIKNQVKLAVTSWWLQTVEQSRPGRPPVLIYKVPYKGWRVVLELDLISSWPTSNGDLVEMDIFAFCNITREIINTSIVVSDFHEARLDS